MFYIKQNDTSPAIQKICLDSTDTPVNVTGASVRFLMRQKGFDTVKVSGIGSVVDGAAGIIKYQWSAGDTDTAGVFEAEFEVTYADSTVETFPNSTYIDVKIIEEIG